MDISRLPALVDLHRCVADLTHCVHDTFGHLPNAYNIPPWVQSLWAEIDLLGSLLEEAQTHGLQVDHFSSTQVEEATRLIPLARHAIQDLKDNVTALHRGTFLPGDFLNVEQSTCDRYYAAVRPCRILLADTLLQLQW